MGMTCSICRHPEREQIDKAILAGDSMRNIAKRYGSTEATIHRHKKHLPEYLILAKEAEQATRADDLMQDLQDLRERALSLLQQAEDAGNYNACVGLIAQARKTIETLAEVRGELNRSATVNIFVNPVFQQVQAVILDELAEYPDVRERIVTRLTEVKKC